MSRNHVSNLGQLNFKIVLLGEGCVGKTSLVLRYVEDKFHEKHFSTIQVSFDSMQRLRVFPEVNKTYFPVPCYRPLSWPKKSTLMGSEWLWPFGTQQVNQDKSMSRNWWLTCCSTGQERFHALGPIYYRDSHAAILVYDITDQDSFVKVKS